MSETTGVGLSIPKIWYRINTETTTVGEKREVYGLLGGGTGDVRVIKTN